MSHNDRWLLSRTIAARNEESYEYVLHSKSLCFGDWDRIRHVVVRMLGEPECRGRKQEGTEGTACPAGKRLRTSARGSSAAACLSTAESIPLAQRAPGCKSNDGRSLRRSPGFGRQSAPSSGCGHRHSAEQSGRRRNRARHWHSPEAGRGYTCSRFRLKHSTEPGRRRKLSPQSRQSGRRLPAG